jgi:hypothetical protein
MAKKMQSQKNRICKFSVFDRLSIPTFFPERGNYETGIVLGDLRKKLQFTQDELDEFELVSKIENGATSFNWNDETEKGHGPFLIELTAREFNVIKKSLEDANTAKTLPISDPRSLAMYKYFTMDALNEKGSANETNN